MKLVMCLSYFFVNVLSVSFYSNGALSQNNTFGYQNRKKYLFISQTVSLFHSLDTAVVFFSNFISVS